eukprot:TRINITY_DN23402_c0_g1_i1.p1 TRINITY_DN23402_c0_g1~~TRINITY_DN23402_c0_g1_i1.p1  ORF type:complete len:192 (+),score=46.80 TRINITY_DN23402_c0_g1_i1:30-605(+)
MADIPNASNSFGKKPMDIKGPFDDVRRRTSPGLYKDIDRAYRAKYLKMWQITPKDQTYHLFNLWDNPDFRKERLNILRRIWQAPGQMVEHALRPVLGMKKAYITRFMLGKAMWGLGAIWYGSYYFLYAKHDWTREGGWRIKESKPMTGPNNPHFPKPDPTLERSSPSDYFTNGFKQSEAAAKISPSTPVSW